MLETLDQCPLCGSHDVAELFGCEDYTVSKETFTLAMCQSCGFTYTSPRPNEQSIGQYYQSDDYISHSYTDKGLINKLYHIVRKVNLRNKLKVANTHADQRRHLLDYGCGTGYFLQTAKEAGWQVTGIEPDPGARQLAIKNSGANVTANLFDNTPQGPFNAITLWHVLEHVHQLDRTLQTLKSLLAPHGALIIAVPNRAAHDAQIYARHWAAYDVPRHLWHFEPGTMKSLLEKNGFALTHKQGMKFDAYYISMLSEQYRHGKSNHLRAFKNGLKSNRLGKKTGNYSSMIYVAKKNDQ